MIPESIKQSVYDAIKAEAQHKTTTNPDSICIYNVLRHAVDQGKTRIIEG